MRHIHVYKVSGVQEFDLDIEDEELAKARALELSRAGEWKRLTGCTAIAIEPQAGEDGA